MESEHTHNSPSNLARRRACPGSLRMEMQCPKDEGSEDATEGTLLHSLLANPFLPEMQKLTEDQRHALDLAGELLSSAHIQSNIIDGVPARTGIAAGTEQKLSFFSSEGDELFKGTADYMMWNPYTKTLLVIDYKFGRAEVTRAEGNLQLAAYGVMGFDYHDENPAMVVVGIIQPRAEYNDRLTLASYNREEIKQVRAEIERIIAATEDQDAALNSSEEACRYCRAKLICPAFQSQFMQLVPTDPKPIIEILDNHTLSRLGEAVKMASSASFGKKIMEEIKRRAESEAGFPGWKLKAAGSVREVTDAKAAFLLLKDQYGGLEAFDADVFLSDCCKVSITALVEFVASVTGAKKAEAERQVNEILAPVIERKEKAASVVME